MTHLVQTSPGPRQRPGRGPWPGRALLVLALLLGTGCKVDTLSVAHVTPPRSAGAAARPVQVEVLDLRPDRGPSSRGRRKVGGAGNPFGGGPTLPDYQVDEPVEAILARAVAGELGRIGRVPAETGGPRLEIGITRFATEITGALVMRAHAEVALQVALGDAGGAPPWSRDIRARVERGVPAMAWNPQRKASEQALNQALDQALAELFSDAAFLERLLE